MRGGRGEIFADLLEHFATTREVARGGAETFNFIVNVVAVLGKLVGEVDELAGHQPTYAEKKAKGEKQDGEERGDAAKLPTLELVGQWRKQEAQKQREGKGDQKFAREIENGDDESDGEESDDARIGAGRSGSGHEGYAGQKACHVL